MSRKARMGRPPLAVGEAKATMFSLRLTPEERDAIGEAAKRVGKPVTQWAREALLSAASLSRKGEAGATSLR